MPVRPLATATLIAGLLLAPCVRARAASIFTPTQQQLLNAQEVTVLFGGNGSVLSRTPDGSGVLFEIAGGTIDFGKVALRILGGGNVSGYDAYGVHVDIVLAPNPVEINPFIQTGPTGSTFVQDVPGVKVQGDSFDTIVPLAGVPNLDNVFGFGFQYFTAGNVVNPPAQTVWIRVSPIPELSPLAAIGLGLALLACSCQRNRTRARAGR